MPTIDIELQQYYETYFDLFNQPGWKQLVGEMEQALKGDQRTAAARCKTNDDWQFERGAQARTQRFLAFETLLRNAYDQLLEAPVTDDEDAS